MPSGVYSRGAPSKQELRAKLYAGLRKTRTCWLWTRAKDSHGYGQICIGHQKHDQAHRVAWRLWVGPIPARRCVLHRCDVPACIRPSHLFLGSMAANSRDMIKKRRDAWVGQRNISAKLTLRQVRQILRKWASGKFTKAALAKQYRVDPSHVSNITRGRAWTRALEES